MFKNLTDKNHVVKFWKSIFGVCKRIPKFYFVVFVGFLFFGLAHSANAATYYVATTGTNNGTCGTLANYSNACATIQYAHDSRASAGDTIKIKTGTYAEAGVAGYALYVTKSVTFTTDDGDVTISNSTRIPLLINNNVNHVTFQGKVAARFIFDGNNNVDRIIDWGTNVDSETFDYCTFQNSTNYVSNNIVTHTNIVFNHWSTSGIAGTKQFYGACPSLSIINGNATITTTLVFANQGATGTFTFTGNNIIVNQPSSPSLPVVLIYKGTYVVYGNTWILTSLKYPLYGDVSGAGTNIFNLGNAANPETITINNSSGNIVYLSYGSSTFTSDNVNITNNSSPTSVLYDYSFYNQTSAVIKNGIIVDNNAPGTGGGFGVIRTTSNTAESILIDKMRITSLTTGTNGEYIIGIGNETGDPSAYNISATITNNNITAPVSPGPHVILIGHQNDPVIKYNYIVGGAYPIVLKGTNYGAGNVWLGTGIVAYNIMRNSDYYAHVKGVKNTIWDNNVFYGHAKKCMYVITNGSNDSTGTVLKNNICYQSGSDTQSTYGFDVDAGSSSGFVSDNNIIFLAGGGSQPQYYGRVGATNYINWTGAGSWQASGYDLHGVNINPLFVNAPSDFSLQSTSPAIDTGVSLGSPYNLGIVPGSTWPSSVSSSSKWSLWIRPRRSLLARR